MDFIWEVLKQLLDYLLSLVDLVGEAVGSILGLGDLLKVVACQACSIATIVTGVLSDFVDGFPLSMCLLVVDKGSTQCDVWGLGDISDIGGAVFGNFIPMFRVLFGLIQVIPALVEVSIELCVLILSSAMEIFPSLLNDAFDIVLWLITSSDVIEALETLFSAIDPMIAEIKAQKKMCRTSGTILMTLCRILAGRRTTRQGVSAFPPSATSDTGCFRQHLRRVVHVK